MSNQRHLQHFALLGDIADLFLLYGNRQLEILVDDKARLCTRSIKISTTNFNLNIFGEQDSLSLFRFRKAEIATVADVFGWTLCRKIRNHYRCDVITARCIVLRRLASPCRWRDVEFLFGMHGSSLSEVFWDILERFLELRSYLFETFRSDLIIER